MPCGAILYFDDQTDAVIRGLWQVIEDFGQMGMMPGIMPGLNYPPHLTLVVCDDMKFDQVREQMKRFIAEHPPLPVYFHGLGIFNAIESVVTLEVTPDRALLELHATFEEVVRPYLVGERDFCRPGRWVPHVTLNQGISRSANGAVVDALMRATLPRYGLLREIVLADFDLERTALTEMFKARLGQYL